MMEMHQCTVPGDRDLMGEAGLQFTASSSHTAICGGACMHA